MPQFCGLTVRGFGINGGPGSQRNELRVDLIQDPWNLDQAVFPPEGTPAYFAFGGLTFAGLFQRVSRHISARGFDYQVSVVDPSEVLDAVAVVTQGYAGVSPMANVMNVYAWYENNFGFGSAKVNASGMPWVFVRQAINYFANSGFSSSYGGRPAYRNFTYGLDISSLPVMPGDYRINLNGASLLQIIEQVCQDAGLDYVIDLQGLTIRVRVIDRAAQASLGHVQSFIDGATLAGLVVSSNVGVESRGETTSVVLAGGPLSDYFLSSEILTYWGDDLDGLPVAGVPAAHPDLPDEYNENFVLPAFEVADILGGTLYPSSLIEMRCALAGQELWTTYVQKYKPDLYAAALGSIYKPADGGAVLKMDVLNENPDRVLAALNDDRQVATNALYTFVKKYADEYYGKRFLARVPDVLVKYDPGEVNPTYSHEPSSTGWVEGGSGALGIALLDQPKFEDTDGRVYPTARLPFLQNLNPTEINPNDSAVVDNALVVRCDVSQRLAAIGYPAAVAWARVELPEAVHRRETFELDGVSRIIVGADSSINDNGAGGTLGELRVYPPAVFPDLIGVPLESNVAVYGPWHASGAVGKVRYDQDTSLVPWEYGGTPQLNAVGVARANAGISLQTRAESADVTFAGAPLMSIGDAVATGGPALTGVSVTYGEAGLLTRYEFQVFSPKPVLGFVRQRAERAAEVSRSDRALRAKGIQQLARRELGADAAKRARAARAFNKALPNWMKRQSPHDTLIAKAVGSRVVASTATLDEALGLTTADKPSEYKNTAVMSLTGLVRPYTTDAAPGPLPKYKMVEALTGANADAVTSADLFPLEAPHDVEALAWGDTYQGMNARTRSPDKDKIRAVALAGPPVLVGRGLDLDGGEVGGARDEPASRKAGPMDPVWDDKRGVWTFHSYEGTVAADADDGTFATLRVGGEADWTIFVLNLTGGQLVKDQRVLASWAANRGHYVVVAGAGGGAEAAADPFTAVCTQKNDDGQVVAVKRRLRRKDKSVVCAEVDPCCLPDWYCVDNEWLTVPIGSCCPGSPASGLQITRIVYVEFTGKDGESTLTLPDGAFLVYAGQYLSTSHFWTGGPGVPPASWTLDDRQVQGGVEFACGAGVLSARWNASGFTANAAPGYVTAPCLLTGSPLNLGAFTYTKTETASCGISRTLTGTVTVRVSSWVVQ